MRFLSLMVFSVVLLSLSACESKQSRLDEDLIQEYVAANGLLAESTPEGVYYFIELEGTGAFPSLTGALTVHYEGTLLDGTVFDSSYDRGVPATFPLSNTIAGWQIGLPFFRAGSSGKLIIPSGLAYGSNPPAGSVIPEDAVLVFRLEVLEVF